TFFFYPGRVECFVDSERVPPAARLFLWRLDHRRNRRPMERRPGDRIAVADNVRTRLAFIPEFLNFEVPRFVSLNDLNGAKRLNVWNAWNGIRLPARMRASRSSVSGAGEGLPYASWRI